MATDYKKIAEEHEKRYGWDAKPRRIYKQLYSDKTHFVSELIQNAEDSKSQRLELQLDSNALLVWNDGRQFEEKDVRSICSLGSSDKDLTHIGTFGIGFKAVYNYTESPEIYSDDERFRIRDFIKPEGIDEMTPDIAKLVNEGKTVFHLPFKNSMHDDIEHLKDRLCNLSKERSLLFLRRLKRVEWKDEHNAQTGSYSCHRHPYDKIQNVPENESVELVKLTVSLNGNNKPSETFLVFCRKVHPQKDVIDKILEQAEDKEEQQRIQQAAEKLQSIEVAFKLQDDRITAMDDNCVLFAYLPTQKETHLRFLIQARYQTTPARDNIPKPSENPWNEWLVKETTDFLPDVLEQLKAGGLLEPAFFNVVPLEADNVPDEFSPIAESLQKAMKERALVPTEKEGYYAKAKNVFYPDTKSLRELVKNSWMPDSSLLHPDIRKGTKESSRCFEVIHAAGVKEIGASNMLFWLEKQSRDWFKNKTNEWLRSLYVYFNRKWHESELERIKKLPLVRLENGQHICPSDGLVFFPPETDEDLEEIQPFLNDLPILQATLLEGDERNDIKTFLKNLGVRALKPNELINEWILPQYQIGKPPEAQNRLHVRYLFKVWVRSCFKVWDKVPEYKRSTLQEEFRYIQILQAHRNDSREVSKFVSPCDAYLPQAYTGDAHLETYFSVSDGDIWFVDDAYMEDKSDAKAWLQFLNAVGAMDTPQVIKKNIPANCVSTQEFNKELDKRNIKKECTTRWSETRIEDYYLQALSEALDKVGKHNYSSEVNLSRSLWILLIKVVKPRLREKSRRSKESDRDAFFQGTYYWFHYKHRSKPFDAMFYCQLQKTAWLPDEQGNLHPPSECFAPTPENRRLLGDSVAYLHPDFEISQDNETEQWLAKKLGIHLNANTDSVLNYLQTLRGTEVSVKDVEPLYRFLEGQRARLREEFKQKPLIFTSNAEPRWWRSDEVFWEDESAVFGNRRGYLKENYADYEATLKPFFSALGVSERAAPLDYIGVIREISSVERAEDAEVRERVKILYGRLQQALREGGSWMESEEWKQTREGRCWLGRKGDEWGFFSRHELVRNDYHDYIAEIFEGEMPFWAFDDDLLGLARKLDVEKVSQTQPEFHPKGQQEKDEVWSVKVRNLRPYIHAFLNSPGLCERPEEGKSADVLNLLSVWLVEELKTTYTLKGISLTHPNPRQSFLDVTKQKATLWLALEADKNAYAWLIGDALQYYFGDVKELSGFVDDLLTKDQENVLTRWKQKGLQTDLCATPIKEDSKKGEENSVEPVDDSIPDETSRGDTDADESGDESERHTDSPPGIGNISLPDTQPMPKTEIGSTPLAEDGPEIETTTVNEIAEIGGGDDNSVIEASATHPYTPRTSGTSRPGGHWKSTSNGGSSRGGHGGRGGGGESEAHRTLKERLADNPSQFGTGLKWVGTEYQFQSGDKVDILFKDSSGKPVTVEVETYIPQGDYVGVWQAVKYQHLAAVKYGLLCEEVRSILAAPEIPDDVKMQCKRLGIEPFEVPDPWRNTSE